MSGQSTFMLQVALIVITAIATGIISFSFRLIIKSMRRQERDTKLARARQELYYIKVDAQHFAFVQALDPDTGKRFVDCFKERMLSIDKDDELLAKIIQKQTFKVD